MHLFGVISHRINTILGDFGAANDFHLCHLLFHSLLFRSFHPLSGGGSTGIRVVTQFSQLDEQSGTMLVRAVPSFALLPVRIVLLENGGKFEVMMPWLLCLPRQFLRVEPLSFFPDRTGLFFFLREPVSVGGQVSGERVEGKGNTEK